MFSLLQFVKAPVAQAQGHPLRPKFEKAHFISTNPSCKLLIKYLK